MESLERNINQLKRELLQSAKQTGISSQDTLYYSQKLDKLIIVYQKSLQNKNSNELVLA